MLYIEETAGVHMPEGNFVLTDGTVIGRHKGSRIIRSDREKGLDWRFSGYPAFVLEIRPDTNEGLWIGTHAESMDWTLCVQTI